MSHPGENTWTRIAESCLSLSLTVPASGTNAPIPGERYRFRVRAENIHGVSEPGDESEFVRIPKEGEMCLQDDEEGKKKKKCIENYFLRKSTFIVCSFEIRKNSKQPSRPDWWKWRMGNYSMIVTKYWKN